VTAVKNQISRFKNLKRARTRVSGLMESPFASKIQLPEEIFNLYFQEVDLTFSGCPAPINFSKCSTSFLLFNYANRRDAQIFLQTSPNKET